MNFSDLGINDTIVQALLEKNITQPSAVQIQVIPQILKNQTDIVAVAQTGTGKTAAFCLPILQTINSQSTEIQALVLVPTRELGQQVAREFFLFSKYLARVFAEAVYGGAPIDEQIQKLKRPTHVVVATPGRLLDLLDRNALNLQHLKYLILDEADEMINMGFKTEIDAILQQCNKNNTKMLFTATMPAEVKLLIKDYLSANYSEIIINENELVNENIAHQYLLYKNDEKFDYLKSFLHINKNQRGIIFCRTKVGAKQLAKQLGGFEVVADALHGNLNQEMRDKVMRGFKKGRINALIATDIAARGIDVKELDYIIHYDLPEKPEQYTHRSGRTARAGKSGVSICFVTANELEFIKMLENDFNIKFSELELKLRAEKPSLAITIYMNIGLNQGFTKATLCEFLIEEAGLYSEEIKNIVVEDNRSYFDVSNNRYTQVVHNIKGYKLAHRNLKLSLDGVLSKKNIY